VSETEIYLVADRFLKKYLEMKMIYLLLVTYFFVTVIIKLN